MADLKISDLSALSGSDLVAADELAIVDDSASETKKITVSNLIANGVTLISDDAIPGAKILFGAGDIATAALADSAVTAAKIGADQVTAAKIADNTIVNLVSTLPTSGDYTGQLALDTDDNSLYVYSGSAWLNTKAPGSVNAFTDTTSGIINISTAVSSGTATVTASIDNTASAAQFLAGPVGSGGTVGYRTIDGGDLPTATTTSKGGVIVNGGGLTLSTDTVQIDNSVTASSTKHLVTYDANGLITGGSVIASSDLPVATSSAKGAVIASDGLAVDASGNLSIDNTVTAGTYTKVTVTSKGVVSSGDTLAAADIPNHSAAKLTSGTISSSLLPNNVVTAGKLADESTVKFGGALGSDNVTIFPAGDFKGQLFWDETSLDLYVYTGSAFIPITVLSGNLVNAGTYNANTNLVSSVTTAGSSAGFAAGSALPAPVGANLNHYVVVETSGTGSGAAPAVALAPPDMLLSNGVGTEYRLIDVSNAIAGQTAANISFIASGTIAATDVQAALQEVDTEKLPKAGGTMTGDLNLGTSTNVVFEGSSADDYETTLTVTNPTADRTITFPNVTGTVVTSGDTGSVTSTMIADGAIVNADINASAEIAVSKLANGTARQLLQTDSGGSGVEFTSNVDVPGTLDVTGNSLFDGTLAVAGVLRANGKLQVFAGTPSSVSICQSISSGDTDTGIYFPTGSGNGIGIASGGAERLFINETGSIGIGAPTSLGNEALRIKSNNSIIAINLDRESDSQSYIRTNANRTAANAFIGGNQYQWNDTTVAAIYAKTGTDTTNKDNGCLTFFTAESGTNAEKMRIDENGKVGIMNSSATFLLDVGNTTNALGQTAGNKLDNFRLVSDTTNADRLNFTCRRLADGANWQTAAHRIQRQIDSSFAGYIQFGGFNANAPDLITFGKDETEYMRIDNLGNVGIGASPGTIKFKVEQTAGTGNINIADFKTPTAGQHNLIRMITRNGANSGTTSVDLQKVYQGGLNINNNDTHSDNYTAFKVGASEALRIDSSGRVGIGTSSFSDSREMLRIQAPSGSDTFVTIKAPSDTGESALFFGDSDFNEGAISYEHNGNNMLFRVDDQERIRIDSSGNLHIGNTTNSAHGDRLLQIGDTSRSASYIEVRTSTSGSGGLLFSDGTAGDSTGYRGTVEYNHTSDYMQFKTAASERMQIDTNGFIGIGTNSAAAHSSSYDGAGLQIHNNVSGKGVNLRLTCNVTGAGAGGGSYLAVDGVNRSLYIYNKESAPIIFGANNSEKARIASTGLISAPGIYSFTTASSANVIVESAGQLSRATSSAKYKRNVETLEDSYADVILNCRPVWYQSKSELDNPSHGFWGFIAEEVAEIDPRLVQWKTNEITYDKDGLVVATPCEPEAESVAYDRFVPHLLNLIKRQQKAIETLETKVAALEAG